MDRRVARMKYLPDKWILGLHSENFPGFWRVRRVREPFSHRLCIRTSFERIDKASYRRSYRWNGVTTNFRGREAMIKKVGEEGGKEGGKRDDWCRVRREARILSESNYRAGRAVVINQIPRRDDATKTNRPQARRIH